MLEVVPLGLVVLGFVVIVAFVDDVGAVVVIAGIAYAVYRYMTPDYLEDFDDDFDDEFDDEDDDQFFN